MGFFSNGTEGDRFEARFCARCVNLRADEFGNACPVWRLHEDWNGEQLEDEVKQMALDLLMPRTEGGLDNRCAMFHARPLTPEEQGQGSLELEEAR